MWQQVDYLERETVRRQLNNMRTGRECLQLMAYKI